MSPLTAAVVILFVGLVLLSLGFAGLSRQLAVLIDQVRAGTASTFPGAAGVVGFRLPASSRLNDLLPDDGELTAIFVSDHCAGCIGIVRQLAQGDALDVRRSETAIVSDGSCGPFADSFDGPCLIDAGSEFKALGVAAVPWMIRVGADGTVRDSRVVRGLTSITADHSDQLGVEQPT